MKKWRYFLIMTAALCLLLCACGRDEQQKTPEARMDGVLMAVGEDTVSGQEAMAYLYLLKQQYEPGMSEAVWSFEIEPEKTMEDYAREAVISNLIQVKLICQEAQAEGASLDEEEAYEAEQAAKQLLEAADEEDIRYFGLTEEVLAEIYKENALAEKFFDITTAKVNTNISDEEARQLTVQYVMVSTEGMDAAQKAEARERAEELLSEAKKASSFLNFASSQSDSEELEKTFGAEDLPEEFGQAALELATGELSQVIEGEQGYYILYCITDFDEDATMAKKEVMIEEERDALFREKYREWSEKYTVVISTPLWEEITFVQKEAEEEEKK